MRANIGSGQITTGNVTQGAMTKINSKKRLGVNSKKQSHNTDQSARSNFLSNISSDPQSSQVKIDPNFLIRQQMSNA